MVSNEAPSPEPAKSWGRVYDDRGVRICSLPDCTSVHKARGLCPTHYWRAKNNGDPYKVSRFATQEEKDAYVAGEIAARNERREATRKQREAEAETFRILRTRSINKIRPQATELIRALDEMSQAERATVADAIAGLLLGQPVEDLIDRNTR